MTNSWHSSHSQEQQFASSPSSYHSSLSSLIPFGLTGIIWGATNPFIQRGAERAHRVNRGSLLRTPEYLIPQVLNLAASAAFTILSSRESTNISRAGPITNAITLATTALTGIILGDRIKIIPATIGILGVILGTYLCAATNQ